MTYCAVFEAFGDDLFSRVRLLESISWFAVLPICEFGFSVVVEMTEDCVAVGENAELFSEVWTLSLLHFLICLESLAVARGVCANRSA